MSLDIVYILLYEGYQFLMVAFCNLSDWVEAKPLCTLFSQVVADFLLEDVICCHNCFRKLIIDEESENKDPVAELTQRYGV